MEKINYSFIIPHHNCPELLVRCINSIPQRSDVEIIVVDDNSLLPLKKEDLRDDVKLITITKENSKGAGRARNAGIDVATGRWLLFADCDDFYSDKLLKSIDMFQDSPLDIIYFDVHHSYDTNTKQEKKSLLTAPIERFLNAPQDKQIISNLKHALNNPWNKMVRHDFVKQINARYHEVPVCNDGWFSHYIAVHTDKIGAINEKLYYWVLNPNGMTNKLQSYTIEKERTKEGYIIKALSKEDKYWTPNYRLFHSMNRWIEQLGIINAFKLFLYRIYCRITIH